MAELNGQVASPPPLARKVSMTNENKIPADVMAKAYEIAIDEVFSAYSVDIFPSPTKEEYARMNIDHSKFVTRNSADMGRRIAGVIRRRAMEIANNLVEDREAVSPQKGSKCQN